MLDAYMLSVAAHNVIFAFHFSLGSLVPSLVHSRFAAVPVGWMWAGVRVPDVPATLTRSPPIDVVEALTWTIALDALRLAA
jgi:hypothetical protein